MSVESFSQAPATTKGNGYVDSVIWVGSTSAGDTCRLEHNSGGRFWEGIAVGDQTYIGVAFPGKGQKATNGIKVSQISSGRVYIYFREE